MAREEEGIVIAVEGDVAKVRASQHNDCDSCGSCAGVGAAVLDVYNPIEAQLGQRVRFELSDEKALTAAFVVYVLPLITAFLGYLFGVWAAAKYALPTVPMEVGGCLLGFALALVYIKIYDRAVSGVSKLPVIKEILPNKAKILEAVFEGQDSQG